MCCRLRRMMLILSWYWLQTKAVLRNGSVNARNGHLIWLLCLTMDQNKVNNWDWITSASAPSRKLNGMLSLPRMIQWYPIQALWRISTFLYWLLIKCINVPRYYTRHQQTFNSIVAYLWLVSRERKKKPNDHVLTIPIRLAQTKWYQWTCPDDAFHWSQTILPD